MYGKLSAGVYLYIAGMKSKPVFEVLADIQDESLVKRGCGTQVGSCELADSERRHLADAICGNYLDEFE